MSKKTNLLMRILSFSIGGVLVVVGLGIGLSVPQRLDLNVTLDAENNWTFRLETTPAFSPLGQVSFETSDDGQRWQVQSADHNGWNGWQGNAVFTASPVTHIRAIMVDGLGKRHEVEESFLSRSALEILPNQVEIQEEANIINIDQVHDALLDQLAGGDRATRAQIATLIKDLRDGRYLPYLVELHRFESNVQEIADALEALSGQRFIGKRAMRLWYEWLWGQSVELNDDFSDWKRKLLADEQPAMAPFLQDRGTLNWPQVVWGGIPPGGIPPLNDPPVLASKEADYLDDGDVVFAAVVNGQARAYPVRMMDWHELANDTLGGEPVLLSYCPLCGSAFLYSRRVGDEIYTFNSSGLLYESNKLMYDEQTFSLWPNLLGQPLAGPLSDSEAMLQRFPLITTTWGSWQKAHPDTDVLNPDLGTFLTYDGNEAYDLYRVEQDALAPVSYYDDRLPAKDWIFGVEVEGQAVAYPMKALQEAGLVNDTINRLNVLLIAEPIPGSQYGFYPATVRAFDRQDRVFTQTDAGIQDQERTLWEVSEMGLVNAKTGETLPRLNGETAYWFAWSNFHRKTLLR